MLRTLRHGFLKEALDFVGVHRERLAEVCKHSIALMMAILGDRGAASRHELFTNEITASIDHIKNGAASGKLTPILPKQFQKHLDFPASDWSEYIFWPIKVCAWNSNLSGTCGVDYASHGLRERQPMQEKTFFFFLSTIMDD